MTDREMKNISTVLRNYIYKYVNENYKDNLDVMNFTLEINEKYMEKWVKDILSHDILWRDPERIASGKNINPLTEVLESIYGLDLVKELHDED